jgi:hypothetical protein
MSVAPLTVSAIPNIQSDGRIYAAGEVLTERRNTENEWERKKGG